MIKSGVGKSFVYLFTGLFVTTFIIINLAGLFFLLTLFTQVAFADAAEISQVNKNCLTCHQDQKKYLVKGGVHEKLNCTSCHMSYIQFPHSKDINIAQEIQKSCQMCHAQTAKEYTVSVHGDEKNQNEKGTTCWSCHGSHDIYKIENPEAKHNRLNSNESCISCHDGRVVEGYNWSFHGVAFNNGYKEAATCIDCHGSHSILPEDNPASMVSIDNRPETCAQCHKTARPNFAKGSEHATPFDKTNALPLYITLQIFIILILFDAVKDSSIAIFDLMRKINSRKVNTKEKHSRDLGQ
ncbi:MAG: cytochrome c3 family protein [Clostridia bacterium]|jgi:nitrate/TMAO reductase-like tetraheme cytochrome c subunit|nr:cytochrome c3 family protein [Clostridia bacterium]